MRALAVVLVLATPLIAHADDDWSPVDDEGWPRGMSLEELRALRPCHYQERLPGPGQPIPCRPPVIAESPQWALGLDWTTGIAAARDVALTGGAHAMGVQLDFALTRRLQLGARYELMGMGTPMDEIGASHRLFGQARWRLFTDEVDRDAIVVTAGGGVALQETSLGGVSPVARIAIAREVGMYLDSENAVTMGLELAYEQDLADTRLAALLVSARLGFEVNIREPANLGTMDAPVGGRHWSDGEAWLGPALGLAYSHGYALGRHLALVGTASYLFGRSEVTKQHGLDEGAQWVAQAGARLLTGWPALVPTYLQVQAGPGWIAEEPARRIAALADAEVGFQFGLTCGAAVNLGFRLRGELDDGVDVTTGMLVLRLGFGGGIDPGQSGGCGRGPEMLTMPTPPPDPVPEPVVVTAEVPPPATTTITTTAEIEADLDVEVTPPEPIVIEVELGAVIAGGLVKIDVDASLLPLDRLRSGLVTVELSGPPAVLLEYERKLKARLDGVSIDAWTNVATTGSVVRAKFTILPAVP